MQTQVLDADMKTIRTIETDDIIAIDGGKIHFSPHAGISPGGSRTGTITGSSITLASGIVINIAQSEFSRLMALLKALGRW